MKFLIAGLGSIGRRHFRNLIALGEKEIVLLRSHRATLPDDELAGYAVETNLDEALRKHKPDAVIISNPTALHLDIAIPAARAGCSILMEKPISNSLGRTDELASALRLGGGQMLVGFQFRFHPSFLQARQLISNGEIGRVVSASVHFGEYLPAWHPWEDYRKGYAARADLGGGVVLTQCHSLDYLPWLVGNQVKSVWGLTGKLSDLEISVEDTAKIGLRFESGALGSLHLDYNQQPPEHTFTIVGSTGTMKWDNASGNLDVYSADKKDWVVYRPPAGFERNVMFVEEMKHFMAVVQNKESPVCNLEDGKQALRLALAAFESNEKGILVKLD
jgi:predicted dehydrogenase